MRDITKGISKQYNIFLLLLIVVQLMLITIKNKTYQKPLSWISLLTIVVLFTSQKEPAFAQVNADSTLPKNSQVIQQGNIYNITGGTQAGSNLFHSFEKFGVPTGGEAYF